MEYISAREAADKWGISQRRVAILCSEQRIEKAAMIGNMWIIPADAQKPADARALRYADSDSKTAKPFLKWAGGKGQLIPEIEKYYPFDDNITKYAEPFVGGGAVLFDILSKYDLEEIYINDISFELMNTYNMIKHHVDDVTERLSLLQEEFTPLSTEKRKIYYGKKRDYFNDLKISTDEQSNIEKSVLMIFLNKTCFNGLYRVNRKGFFNVPMGSYKHPLICDENNLKAVSEKLKNVTITWGNYLVCDRFVDSHTFIYLDPPYRPITDTAGFTSYSENQFSDKEQMELARFVNKLNHRGAKILLSNSDPKNTNINDNFFDNIYSKYNIKRVEANRMINCNGSSRGKIKELLISNF